MEQAAEAPSHGFGRLPATLRPIARGCSQSLRSHRPGRLSRRGSNQSRARRAARNRPSVVHGYVDQAMSGETGTITCWSDRKLPSDTNARPALPLHFRQGASQPTFPASLRLHLGPEGQFRNLRLHPPDMPKQATGEIEHAKNADPLRFNRLIRGCHPPPTAFGVSRSVSRLQPCPFSVRCLQP